MDGLINSDLFRILSWTLIHSLWQGLLLSFLGGLLMVTTVKSRPVPRYNLLSALFVVFLASVILTCCLQTRAATPSFQIGATDTQSFVGWFYRAVDHTSLYIALFWFFVLIYKAASIRRDLRQVQIISNKGCHPVSHEQLERFRNLCIKLGVDRPVKLMESALVKVPVVLGHLKPMILVPAGLLAKLPCDEIEAILLHELAHVKRNDYLVNLIQRITEAIFFFNPALLWISQQMRIEREHCCDDTAISVSGNKAGYVQALISCKEFMSGQQFYAPAFYSKKHLLVARVSRIVYNRNAPIPVMHRFIVTTVFPLVLVLLFVLQPALMPSHLPDTFTVATGSTTGHLENAPTPINETNVKAKSNRSLLKTATNNRQPVNSRVVQHGKHGVLRYQSSIINDAKTKLSQTDLEIQQLYLEEQQAASEVIHADQLRKLAVVRNFHADNAAQHDGDQKINAGQQKLNRLVANHYTHYERISLEQEQQHEAQRRMALEQAKQIVALRTLQTEHIKQEEYQRRLTAELVQQNADLQRSAAAQSKHDALRQKMLAERARQEAALKQHVELQEAAIRLMKK